jgi:hypothetical protein
MKQETQDQEVADEYHYLTNRLDTVKVAIEGSCDDIDCDQFIYKDILIDECGPVLNHQSSCMQHLHKEHAALMRILSMQRYAQERYRSCDVCQDQLDTLGEEYTIVGYMQEIQGEEVYEYRSYCVHAGCKMEVRIPDGWKKC